MLQYCPQFAAAQDRVWLAFPNNSCVLVQPPYLSLLALFQGLMRLRSLRRAELSYDERPAARAMEKNQMLVAASYRVSHADSVACFPYSLVRVFSRRCACHLGFSCTRSSKIVWLLGKAQVHCHILSQAENEWNPTRSVFCRASTVFGLESVP